MSRFTMSKARAPSAEMVLPRDLGRWGEFHLKSPGFLKEKKVKKSVKNTEEHWDLKKNKLKRMWR